MTRDELAKAIHEAVRTSDWVSPATNKDEWRKAADAAATALGIELDEEPDPRYVAAMGVFARSSCFTNEGRDLIARAIVVALDADGEAMR